MPVEEYLGAQEAKHRQKIMETVGGLMAALGCTMEKKCTLDNKDLKHAGKGLAFMAELAPASFKDIALVIQENGSHRDRYRLGVRFVDNYGRKYKKTIALNVAEHGYQYETTERVGGLPAQKSPA